MSLQGLAGELVNVLKEAGQIVPADLLKFGTHVKKKVIISLSSLSTCSYILCACMHICILCQLVTYIIFKRNLQQINSKM